MSSARSGVCPASTRYIVARGHSRSDAAAYRPKPAASRACRSSRPSYLLGTVGPISVPDTILPVSPRHVIRHAVRCFSLRRPTRSVIRANVSPGALHGSPLFSDRGWQSACRRAMEVARGPMEVVPAIRSSDRCRRSSAPARHADPPESPARVDGSAEPGRPRSNLGRNSGIAAPGNRNIGSGESITPRRLPGTPCGEGGTGRSAWNSPTVIFARDWPLMTPAARWRARHAVEEHRR